MTPILNCGGKRKPVHRTEPSGIHSYLSTCPGRIGMRTIEHLVDGRWNLGTPYHGDLSDE